jgi:hypothetical protein
MSQRPLLSGLLVVQNLMNSRCLIPELALSLRRPYLRLTVPTARRRWTGFRWSLRTATFSSPRRFHGIQTFMVSEKSLPAAASAVISGQREELGPSRQCGIAIFKTLSIRICTLSCLLHANKPTHRMRFLGMDHMQFTSSIVSTNQRIAHKVMAYFCLGERSHFPLGHSYAEQSLQLGWC